MQSKDILFEEIDAHDGNIGLITLNRPQALNALTYEMVLSLTQNLRTWEKASHIKAIVIQSNHEKAFCAGGDIRKVYEMGITKSDDITQFFYAEYQLNHLIFHYSKPYIALLNGITMGGGAGISIHGSHPIGTEKLIFAMPETSIGFFPDVGASYFLSRCLGQIGIYLGLTSTRLNLEDCIYAGMIHHHLASDSLNDFLNQLIQTPLGKNPKETVTQIIKSFSHSLNASSLIQYRDLIDTCFSSEYIESIISNLGNQNNPWCQKTIEILKTKSPTSLKITLRELQCGTKLNFDECMQMEYRLATRCLKNHNFYEGVRALLIDKDQKPHWQPTQLSSINDALIDPYFASLKDKELTFQ